MSLYLFHFKKENTSFCTDPGGIGENQEGFVFSNFGNRFLPFVKLFTNFLKIVKDFNT